MDEQLKKLLRDMQEKENSRKVVIDGIEADIKRVDLREETETERFTEGIDEDRKAGLYNHKTDGQMQKIIDEELQKIKAKYDSQRAELNKKLEETKKQHEEEKANDYKQISAAIKDYHLEMVLAVNKANKELTETEAERNAKLKEIDEKIAAKKAEQTHMIIKNRNFMDIEASVASADIKILGQEIEKLEDERNNIDSEYTSKLKEQSDIVQYYSQQKERAAKFIGSIRLSEKSIEEIYEILFDKEREEELDQDQGKAQGADGKVQGADGKAQGADGKTQGADGKAQGADGKTQGADGKAQGADGKAQGADGKVQGADGKVQGADGKAQGADGKVQGADGKAQGAGARKQGEQNPANLKNFRIEVTKEGSRFVILRDGEEEPTFGDWHETYEAGEHLENNAFEEQNKKMLKTARLVGDKFIVNEIVLAVTSKKISYEEGQMLLNSYVETLSGKEMKDSSFEILYNLKGLSKSELGEEQKEYIEKKAKEAKMFEKLGNVKVKPGFFRTIGWKLEKIGTKLNNLWNKNKALPEPKAGEKQSAEYMNQRKQALKERLRTTGQVTENQQLGQGLNQALREQDQIKKGIDNEGPEI